MYNYLKGENQLKRVVVFLIIISNILLLFGCGAGTSGYSTEFFSMDTVITVSAYGKKADEALSAAEKESNRLNDLLSVNGPESEINRLNADGSAVLSEESINIINTAVDLYYMTDGAFDITIYPIVDLWGFYTGEHYVPKDSELSELLKNTGCEKLVIEGSVVSFELPDMAIDLGGIAKGYASDKVAETVRSCGVKSAIMSFGGNVYAVGGRPDGSRWRVAIQDPADNSAYAGILELYDQVAITSGGYQRFFEQDGVRYHHIIDPDTGRPADNGVTSVTIVCDSGILADGLSTALFVMGYDKAVEFWREHSDMFDAVIINDRSEIFVTEGIKDIFSSDSAFEVISR